jgi:hypothetical protein
MEGWKRNPRSLFFIDLYRNILRSYFFPYLCFNKYLVANENFIWEEPILLRSYIYGLYVLDRKKREKERKKREEEKENVENS